MATSPLRVKEELSPPAFRQALRATGRAGLCLLWQNEPEGSRNMSITMQITRKELLKAAVAWGGAGIALAFLESACGPNGNAPSDPLGGGGQPDLGSPDSDGGLAYCPNGAQNGIVTANHGHSLYVPRADIEAAQPVEYNIRGTSPHPHYLPLTAEHFAMLAQNQSFRITSTNNAGHTHDVEVMCAP
jgi:hypothetical protein